MFALQAWGPEIELRNLCPTCYVWWYMPVIPVLGSQRQSCWLASLAKLVTPHIPETQSLTHKADSSQGRTPKVILWPPPAGRDEHTHTSTGTHKESEEVKGLIKTYKNFPPTSLGHRGLEGVSELTRQDSQSRWVNQCRLSPRPRN